MTRRDFAPYHVAAPDGLVHRAHYYAMTISDETACGRMFDRLYRRDDPRPYHLQFSRTQDPVTCLQCLVQPMEIDRHDD